MCGRYASARKRIELLEEFSVERDRVAEELPPDYNVAPTKPVYGVLARRGRPQDRVGQAEQAASGADSAPAAAAEPADAVARELRVLRWGLVPSWANDITIGNRLINARAETVSEKPAFRRAFALRRCLLPADGYYEWQRLSDAAKAGSGGAVSDKAGPGKQPFYITRADGGPLAFAGLYELWRDRAHPDGDPDAWLWTAVIITTSAPDDLGRIHDRMPMVIDPASWADWLDPGNSDAADLRALLAPAAASGLISYPVSREVNSVRHNGPELIRPAESPPPAESSAGGRSGTGRGVSGSEPETLF